MLPAEEPPVERAPATHIAALLADVPAAGIADEPVDASARGPQDVQARYASGGLYLRRVVVRVQLVVSGSSLRMK